MRGDQHRRVLTWRELIQLVDCADVDASGVLVDHEVVELRDLGVEPRKLVGELLDNVLLAEGALDEQRKEQEAKSGSGQC